ncbi:MAG: thioesterase II family protein [Candidatus Bipolaricaulia bacterium]
MTTPTLHSWITYPKLNTQASLRLFCFPYAGGGASIFHTWSDDLPSDIEVCPVQLPGRENRLMEPPVTRLSSLVQTLAQALHPYLNIPFAFFGHSMGALISFELARQLRRRNDLSPVHLFVSGHHAPQIPNPNSPIHRLPESTFVKALRRLDGTPESVLQNTELMELLLPVLRADFAICETYVYSTEDPLDCPISAFGGLQDREVSYDDLAAWCDQTHRSFAIRTFPGNHFFLQSARVPVLRAISQDLTRFLRITGGQHS